MDFGLEQKGKKRVVRESGRSFDGRAGGHDPDGIRTRVAALKGPCPRPLDDGADQRGQDNTR